MPTTLYIVDGHSQLYMAYHALEGLTAPDGTPTNAVYGFVNMLRKLLREHVPDDLIVTFDAPGPTFRHERYPEYKATRRETPADLRSQLELLREVLDAWPIRTLMMPGFEADDVLATLVARFSEPGRKIVLVTADKDARQLLAEGRVEIFDSRRDAWITEAKLLEKDGIRPDQVVDWLTLVGDSSDNIPGVPLIGRKTASTLLAEHDTLEALLAAADGIRGKRGENLRAARETAPAMRELVQLRTDVPLELALDACRLKAPDGRQLLPIYRRLGFTRWLDELQPAELEAETLDHRPVAGAAELDALLTELRAAPRLAIALVTENDDRIGGRLLGVGLCATPGRARYLPLAPTGGRPAPVPRERATAALRSLLEDPSLSKVGHDLKPATIVLGRHGIELAPIGFDTLLGAYLLNPTHAEIALEELALTHLGLKVPTLKEQLGRGGRRLDASPEALCEHAARAADLALRMEGVLAETLAANQLGRLLTEIELPLLPVLARMELAGIAIDSGLLAELGVELTAEIDALRAEIHALAGEEVNIDSPRQLGELLFETLGLPRGRRTKTGWSTDAAVLAELTDQHPLPGKVLAYRQRVKLKGTYVDALPQLVHPFTGRIHTQFNQATAATGRLSSSSPNLQNIPIRTERGRRIRGAFVAAEGRQLLSADYSQIELRVLAHVCADPALREAFAAGKDIHRAVAARIAGCDEADVTRAQRGQAKTVNFGIIYGQTPFGLAQELEIPQAEAKAFIERYFEQFPRVKSWIEETLEAARKSVQVRTLHDRVRYLPDINSRNYGRRGFAERTAVNTVIQGSAADLIKIAMIRIAGRLAAEPLPAQLLLTIHDELLFEVDPEAVEPLAAMVREEMTGAMTLEVPLVVDIGVGPSWLAAGERQLVPGASA